MLVDVLGLFERWNLDEVQVRAGHNGDEAWACCPLHGESKPSFSVNMETGKWHCFGCHARGTTIDSLVAAVEDTSDPIQIRLVLDAAGTRSIGSIRDALRMKLAERRQPVAEDKTSTDEWRRYSPTLLSGYLKERGYTAKSAREYQLGYDFEKKRLVIPVFEHGVCRFVYTRATRKQQVPKYKYPAEVEVSNYLFGLHKSPEAYRNAVITLSEGALDAVWVRQNLHGVEPCAIFGSSLSARQASKIAALSPRDVVLLFDNDEAGVDATDLAIRQLTFAGVRSVSVALYPRGTSGYDPANLTAAELAGMISKRVSQHHFVLRPKIRESTRIRRLLDTQSKQKKKQRKS